MLQLDKVTVYFGKEIGQSNIGGFISPNGLQFEYSQDASITVTCADTK